jgi:hypothetical protein
MFDDFTIEFSHFILRELDWESTAPFELFGILFTPDFDDEGNITKYKSSLKNLRVELSKEKITVKNSWHKFAHSGDNSGLFDVESLIEVIKELSNIFRTELRSAVIKRITLGINVIVAKAEPYWKNILSYKGTFPNPMVSRSNKKQYGVYFLIARGNKLKVYDKSLERKITQKQIIDETIRFEYEFSLAYERKLKGSDLNIYRVEDLLDNLQELGRHFSKRISYLEYSTDISIEDADNFIEGTAILWLSNPANAKKLKEFRDPKSLRKYKNIYKELAEGKGMIYLEVIQEKILQLYNRESATWKSTIYNL